MLKKESQKKIARAQDIIVEEMVKSFQGAVLHGGTAIWRCYQGNRFSEDVDAYIPKDMKKIINFFNNLRKRDFVVEKEKIGENSLYSTLIFEGVTVRFESVFKLLKGELKDYEAVDGNLNTIRTLLPEELIKEKIGAYLKRLKIRDLYDIFFLLRHVKNKEEIRKELKTFLKNFKNPMDREDLKLLIITGIVPNIEEMLSYIKREGANG